MSKEIKTNSVYELDQFFTKEEVAAECVKELNSIYNINQFDLIIEPSAGTGSFTKSLFTTTEKISIEIDQKLCEINPNYLHQSFFDYNPEINNRKILVIGNPPFGTQNKLSVDFFNHAANFADVIAFIIPRTWNKQSIHNRLNKKFILVKTIDLNKDCFYGNKKTNVKCCFQIWKKSLLDRVKEKKCISHKDWDFLPYIKSKNNLSPPSNADFIILAYGCNSGQISMDLFKWRPKSVHFIKSKIGKKKLIKRFSDLNFSCANNSARQSSLCKGDLVRLYIEKYGS